jgi:hypothetical protein
LAGKLVGSARKAVRRVGGVYGLRVYRNGVELKGDGRKRERLPGGHKVIVREKGRSHFRGKIRAWSQSSARRLAFIAANVDMFFAVHVTLTYRARQASWETQGDRNRRFVGRCRADLHQFLRALREELGEYLWVREFQERGVVHFHVLAEKELSQARATEAWARASGQLEDEAVLRHGVKVDSIKSQGGATRYLGQYIGKERQKELPKGVDGAGRWWGRSRGLKLAMLEDIAWLDRSEMLRRNAQLRIARILRRFLEKRFRRRYRGGSFIDYGGKLSAMLAGLTGRLREFYGWDPTLEERLEAHGWEAVTEGEADGQHAGGDSQAGSEVGVGGAEPETGGNDGGAHQEELFAA